MNRYGVGGQMQITITFQQGITNSTKTRWNWSTLPFVFESDHAVPETSLFSKTGVFLLYYSAKYALKHCC
jgi:hypothetical protein